jgi:hypothetical protein
MRNILQSKPPWLFSKIIFYNIVYTYIIMATPHPDETPERFVEPRQTLSPRDEPTLAELHKALKVQKDEIDAQLTSIMKHLAAGGTDTRTQGWKTELSENFDLIKGILQKCLDKISVRSPVRKIFSGGGGSGDGPRFIF